MLFTTTTADRAVHPVQRPGALALRSVFFVGLALASLAGPPAAFAQSVAGGASHAAAVAQAANQ
ncbi:MAG TPA: hypothetical protein VF516_38665, partial [Kofleriaceae bacterium]